jgi:hypothetical protein
MGHLLARWGGGRILPYCRPYMELEEALSFGEGLVQRLDDTLCRATAQAPKPRLRLNLVFTNPS